MLKITAVRTTPIRAPLDYPYWSATQGGLDQRLAVSTSRSILLVEIETNEGLVGLGQCISAGRNLKVLDTLIKEELGGYLIDQDALARERLWDEIYRATFQHGRKGNTIAALSGLDIALWDLAGQVHNAPIYQLLGAARDSMPVYGSAGFYAEGKGDRELAAEIEGLVAEGFRAVKMKIGCLSIEDDLARVELVRNTLPKGYGLMVDANRSYSPKVALRVARRLEELEVRFFEEPTNPDDLAGAAVVAAGSPVAIAGYETEYTRYGYRELIVRRAVDIVQPNVCWCGGISEGKKIAVLASAFHLECAPHTFGSPLTLICNLHLAASLPNATMVEFDRTGNPMMRELLEEPLKIDAESRVRMPSGPGLGVKLSKAAVEKWRLDR